MSEPAVITYIRGDSSHLQKEFEKAGKATQVFAAKAEQTSKALSRVQSNVSGLTMGAQSIGMLATQIGQNTGASAAFTSTVGTMTAGVMQARYAVMALAVAKHALLGPIGLATAAASALAATYLYMRNQSKAAEQAEKDRKATIDGMTRSIQDRAAALMVDSQRMEIIKARMRGADQDEIARMARGHIMENALKRQQDMERAATRIMVDLLSKEDKYALARREYNELLAAGLINMDEHSQAVERARIAIVGLSESEERQKALVQEAARIRAEAITPLQVYDQRIRQLDEMLSQTLINQAQYAAEIDKARKSMEAAIGPSAEYLEGQKALKDMLADKAHWTRTATSLLARYSSEEDRAVEQIVLAAKAYEAGALNAAEYGRIIAGLTGGAKETANAFKDIAKSGVQMLSDSLVELALTGENTFAQIGDAMLRMALNQVVMSSMQGIFPSLFASAQGNAFQSGRVIAMARGGIVDHPTLFPMARGAGLMGEAGPEAVMPLGRTSSGDLGVKLAGGGGGAVTVNVINQAPNTEASTRETTGPNGEREIEVVIVQAVRGGIARGALDGAMSGRFGVSPRGNRR